MIFWISFCDLFNWPVFKPQIVIILLQFGQFTNLKRLAHEPSTSLDQDSLPGPLPGPGPGPGPGFSKVTPDFWSWSFRGGRSSSLMAVQKTVAKSCGSNRPKSTSNGECFFASLLRYLTIVLVSLMCFIIFFNMDMRYIMSCCKSSFIRNSLCFLPRYWRNVRFMLGWVSNNTRNTWTPTWKKQKQNQCTYTIKISQCRVKLF